MYNEKIESLIKAALADGMLTEKEKQILFKRAAAEGIDLDEFEMILDARIMESKKSDKVNKNQIDKCPACGALRPAFAATCPECGYEFRDSKSHVVSDLSNKLEEILKVAETKDWADHSFGGAFDNPGYQDTHRNKWVVSQQREIIDNFPIPHTKEDVLELLYFIHPKVIGERNRLTSIWIKKEVEIINRAKQIFANNDQTLQTILTVEKECKKRKGFLTWYASLSPAGRFFFWYLTIIVSITLIVVFSLVNFTSNDKEVMEQLNNNQAASAYNIYITDPDVVSEGVVKQLITTLVQSGELEKATTCLREIDDYNERLDFIDLIMQEYHKNGDINAIEKLYIKNKYCWGAYELYLSYANKYRNYKPIKEL